MSNAYELSFNYKSLTDSITNSEVQSHLKYTIAVQMEGGGGPSSSGAHGEMVSWKELNRIFLINNIILLIF